MAQSNLYGRREDGLIFWNYNAWQNYLINNVLWWTLPIATGSSTNHEIKLYVKWVKYKNSVFSYFTKILSLKDETLKREETFVIIFVIACWKSRRPGSTPDHQTQNLRW